MGPHGMSRALGNMGLFVARTELDLFIAKRTVIYPNFGGITGNLKAAKWGSGRRIVDWHEVAGGNGEIFFSRTIIEQKVSQLQ